EMSDPAKIEASLDAVERHFAGAAVNKLDGLRIDFEAERKWFILRKSNTEPIIRIYAEAPTAATADALAQEVIAVIEG
ncbi:MAG: phosphoglucosamine mutase, partial [Bacteroidales bacterium]